jgi:hypothetical protein
MLPDRPEEHRRGQASRDEPRHHENQKQTLGNERANLKAACDANHALSTMSLVTLATVSITLSLCLASRRTAASGSSNVNAVQHA